MIKIKHRSIKQKLLLLFISAAIPYGFISYVSDQSGVDDNFFQLLVIGFLSTLGVLNAAGRQFVSLRFMHWFFCFIFFFISPLVRLQYNLFPLVAISPNMLSVISTTNNIIITWCLIFGASSEFFRRSGSGISVEAVAVTKQLAIGKPTLLLSAASLLLITIAVATSPLGLFVRSGGLYAAGGNQIIALVFENFVRPLFFFSWLILLKISRTQTVKSREYTFFLYILGATAILLNFPTATARFYAFALYLSLVMTVFLYDRMSRSYIMIPVMGAAVAGSEIFNLFRSIPTAQQMAGLNVNSEFWGGIDFDAYEMLACAVLYVDKLGVSYGYNIAGGLLFFVPRSIWPSKPIGSGSMIMLDYFGRLNPYGAFTNVSCPLVAEGYLAGGIIGVVLVAILLGSATSLIDGWGIRTVERFAVAPLTTTLLPGYFVAAGLIFFIMRGDFLSSSAYTIGIFASYRFALYLIGLRLNIGWIRRLPPYPKLMLGSLPSKGA